MLQIGAFSVLSQIGIRTLRYYADFGLLVPAYIDEATNYRYYTEEQLVLANRIEALRAMGMSLRQIKRILVQYDSAESIKDILHEEIRRKEAEISEGQAQLQLLRAADEYFDNESYRYHCNVTVKEFSGERVLCYRSKVSSYRREAALWNSLYEYAESNQVSFTVPPVNIAIYHDQEHKENDIDIEVQKGISGTAPENRPFRTAVRPPVLAATVTMKGDLFYYPELNRSVAHWVLHNGYDFNGPMFNIYHVPPYMDQEPIVEVCYPIKQSNGRTQRRAGRTRTGDGSKGADAWHEGYGFK